MVKISHVFPKRFLSGEDLQGKEVNVTIKCVKTEQVFSKQKNGKEEVLVIYFENKVKGVILKKTRSYDIVKILGNDDTDTWAGKKVCLYTEKKNAGGEMHDVFRFKAPAENPDELSEEEKKALNAELNKASL